MDKIAENTFITVPVYLDTTFKHKKAIKKNKDTGKYRVALSYNEILIMNRFAYSKIKKQFASEISDSLDKLNL